MRTLLKNGKIYDGTGKDAFAGDILIEDEKIAAVGPAIDETADEVIDLEGLTRAANASRMPRPPMRKQRPPPCSAQ